MNSSQHYIALFGNEAITMSGKPARSKCGISRADLLNAMKYTIDEPGRAYLEGSTDTIINSYKKFFQRVAAETDRLNGVAVAACVKELFALGPHDAAMFGTALSKAFAAMKIKGNKAITGGRLSPAVKKVFRAIPRGKSWRSLGASAEERLRTAEDGKSWMSLGLSAEERLRTAEDDENLECKAELLHTTPARKLPERKLKLEISDVILDPAELYRMYQARPTIKMEQVAHRLARVCMYMSRI